jgi:hypothetical protein
MLSAASGGSRTSATLDHEHVIGVVIGFFPLDAASVRFCGRITLPTYGEFRRIFRRSKFSGSLKYRGTSPNFSHCTGESYGQDHSRSLSEESNSARMDLSTKRNVGSDLGLGKAGHVGGNTTKVAGIQSKDSV